MVSLCACTSGPPPAIAEAYQELPERIDFNFHVRPILSDRCYACHGPDEQARSGDVDARHLRGVGPQARLSDGVVDPQPHRWPARDRRAGRVRW